LPSSQLSSTLAAEEQKLLACIHCGLCLEACPTYVVTGDENDGPRGRLYLMRAVGEGRLANNSPSFERHIDRCLGCRACEQVCPAGVEYGQLLEAARGELFQAGPARGISYGLLRFALKHVWLHPARLRLSFRAARLFRDAGLARLLRKSGVAGLLSNRIEFAVALLESSAARKRTVNTADSVKANSQSAEAVDVMLFAGCVGSGLFSRVNVATARVLAVNGFAVKTPSRQVCCGALHAHAGDLEGARILARKNIAAFADDETPIITNAGGCGAMLTTYGHLLTHDAEFAEQATQFSARVRDVSQQLETVAIELEQTSEATERVTYDASCHLLYGQHAGEAPLRMLGATGALNFAKLEGSERCCGGAGIYNLLEPDLSAEVLKEKLANIQATGATVLATGNPGCQMQIGAGALLAGMDLRTCHPVELLDEAYARTGKYERKG
jgi:glycolate oxidase iron-sulfur subunit